MYGMYYIYVWRLVGNPVDPHFFYFLPLSEGKKKRNELELSLI